MPTEVTSSQCIVWLLHIAEQTVARLQRLNATLQSNLMSQRHRLTRLAGKLLLTSGWRPSASKQASCSNQQLGSSSGCGPSAVRAGTCLQAHEQRFSSAAQHSVLCQAKSGLGACLHASLQSSCRRSKAQALKWTLGREDLSASCNLVCSLVRS